MTNVLYLFTDLKTMALHLVKDLKAADLQKTTLYKQQKVGEVADLLLQSYLEELADVKKVLSPREKDRSFSHKISVLENSFAPAATKPSPNEDDGMAYRWYWLLQQYIRQALNNQQLLQKEFYFPFLNEVMRGLAQHYETVPAPEGSVLKVEIVGAAGGVWCIEKKESVWQLSSTSIINPGTTVYLDQQIAWLLFTDKVVLNEIAPYYQIIGDKNLGSHFLLLRI